MSLSEKQKIVDIMKAVTPAYFATCDGNQPRVRAVSPIIEDDMSIWVGTHTTSRKIKQIKQNPKVSLAFIQPPSAARGERAAIVLGEAAIIPSVKERKRFWRLWPSVYSDFDLDREYLNGPGSSEFCLIKIIVKRVEWWTENEPMKSYELEK